jgi:aryl-alcohol dehydrogenase-like predicted oxidoreductase
MLGVALEGKRTNVILVGATTAKGSEQSLRDRIFANVTASLRRLRTDHLDVLTFASPRLDEDYVEVSSVLGELVSSGKVRFTAFTNLPGWRIGEIVATQEARGLLRFGLGQVLYSLLHREIEHDVVPFAIRHGLGLLTWGGLEGGLLSGRYTRENPTGDGGRRATFDFPPVSRDEVYAVVDVLREVGHEIDAKPAEVALAWILAKPFVAAVLVGASSVAQLESNLNAEGLKLTDAHVQRLDTATAKPIPYPNWLYEGQLDRAEGRGA